MPPGPRRKPRKSPRRESPSEIYLVSREAAREIDRLASAEFSMPSILLMENAARHVADVALDMMEDIAEPRVLVVCGPGNNGGDGLAIARHLFNAGLDVVITLLEPEKTLKGDAAINAEVARKFGIPMHELGASPGETLALLAHDASRARPRDGFDLVIDALFGTGLARALAGRARNAVEAIRALRAMGSTVLAVDIPSGLESDTGEVLGAAVEADATVTFLGLKPGMLSLSAQRHLGEVIIADIGAPRTLLERLGTRLPHGRSEDEPENQDEPPEPPRRR